MNSKLTKLTSRSRLAVATWLGLICLMLLCMIAIGGVTRLTGSGLSIVDWNPIVGAIPPLNESQWLEVFARYQSSPQFRQVNSTMGLADFKVIFFWEYFHRLIGRGLGVVFFFPWLYFTFRGHVSRSTSIKLLGGFALGGLQGALGWFMVVSGLVDIPRVSHFRLAAHLLLAFFILGYFFHFLLAYLRPEPAGDLKAPLSAQAMAEAPEGVIPDRLKLRKAAKILLGLIVLQVTYGAFTAGLRAGLIYNTFPSMNGHWFPEGLFTLQPLWRNLLENPTTIQFIHRGLAWVLLIGITGAWAYSLRLPGKDPVRKSFALLWLMTMVQFSLGIATLLLRVPVALGTLHQVGGALLFLAALNCLERIPTFKKGKLRALVPGHTAATFPF